MPSGEDVGVWVEGVIWTLRHLQAYCGFSAGLLQAIWDCETDLWHWDGVVCNAFVTSRSVSAV